MNSRETIILKESNYYFSYYTPVIINSHRVYNFTYKLTLLFIHIIQYINTNFCECCWYLYSRQYIIIAMTVLFNSRRILITIVVLFIRMHSNGLHKS